MRLPRGVAPRAGARLEPTRVLRWIYAGRVAVALGVYGAAVFIGQPWGSDGLTDPVTREVAIGALVAALLLTPLSWLYSHRRERPPGTLFLGAQALLDVVLVTGIVHLTGGSESVLAPILYIALVSGYALLLPLALALLVALFTGVAYLFDLWLAYPELLDTTVLAQVVIFTVVALVSGAIGGRLRQVDAKLTDLEGELRRLQLGTSDILRSIGSGVVTLDDGGRVAYLNPAAEELLGIEAAEWLGRDLLAELETRAPAVASAVRSSMATGGPVADQDVEILRNGERRPAAVSTDLLERPGGSPLVTVVLQDMRMARRLEELHLRASRLEAVAELSASLAHEIKNPLASIRSAVEQLAESVGEEAGEPPASSGDGPGAAGDGPGSAGDGTDEDRATLARLIVRETDRLDRLLSEFNDFARVDVIERKPIRVRRLVEDVVALVRQRPEARERAALEVAVEEPLEDLWGDPDLLHRTLFNLVLNAVQLGTRDGRSVRVRVVADALRPEAVPRDVSPGHPVRIRVIDDGPGVAREDLPRIFDPFYTRREGGSGMGLAIAHRAVQAHGGALLVQATPGGGATFVVVLPRRDWRERRELEEVGWAGPREGRSETQTAEAEEMAAASVVAHGDTQEAGRR